MKAKNLKDLDPKFNSKFFLDSNVWLYLYYPQFSKISKHLIDRYSSFYEAIITKECLIITDMIQMSELINTVLQAEYKSYCREKTYLTFKDFREKPEYLNALVNAKSLTTNILKVTTLRGGIFSPDELKSMVNKCDRADFNDIFFAQFCSKENATLITHDFDFNALDVDIELYTCNSKYIV